MGRERNGSRQSVIPKVAGVAIDLPFKKMGGLERTHPSLLRLWSLNIPRFSFSFACVKICQHNTASDVLHALNIRGCISKSK